MAKTATSTPTSPTPPRRTKQRAAILETLEAAHGPLNAQEILKAAAKKSAGLGLATVYRHVKALCESGDLTEVHVPGESPRYEPAGREHHHHFLCTRCARLFEVQGCPGNLGHLTPPGFTLERHEITLIGLCDLCTATPAPKQAKPTKPDSSKRPAHTHSHPHHH